MVAAPVFLAVDSGTSRMKAALLDQKGQIAALESCDIASIHPFNGASEADMGLTWRSFCRLTVTLAEKHPDLWKNLACVCITGQGDGCWPMDQHGQPVRNAMLWNDTRSRQLEISNMQEIEQFCIDHSQTALFPGAAPMLLLWLKQFEPEAYSRVRHVLHCKDWLNYCLTGEIVTDFSDASTALMDIRGCKYENGLLDLLQIGESAAYFPPLVGAGTIIGSITLAAAQQSAIPSGLPVRLGGIDVSVVAAGAGVTRPGDALTIIGTTLCNEVVLEETKIDGRDTRGSTLRHVAAGNFLRLMATSSGTSSIDWARRILAAGRSFDEIEEELSRLQPGSDGVMFQPYLYGERAPFREPTACAGFYGLLARHTPMHMLRAVYEGLMLSTMDCYRALPDVHSIAVAGGGSNSSVLCQMMADGLGKPVKQMLVGELGLLGAYHLMKNPTDLQPESSPLDASLYRLFEPDFQRHRLYCDLYEMFVDLRQSISAYWNTREVVFRNQNYRG